jgi:4-hydroxy-3-methylbut-2-enyl diphosphate reductase
MAAVNQTTMLHSETVEIQAAPRGAVETRGGAFRASNTVCRATQERQDAARDLCQARCELRIVVGGFDSSNTNRLHALASAAGPAYFVQNADAIKPNAIRHFDPESREMKTKTHWRPPEPCTIGLLAGASCPDGIVGDIIRALPAKP